MGITTNTNRRDRGIKAWNKISLGWNGRNKQKKEREKRIKCVGFNDPFINIDEMMFLSLVLSSIVAILVLYGCGTMLCPYFFSVDSPSLFLLSSLLHTWRPTHHRYTLMRATHVCRQPSTPKWETRNPFDWKRHSERSAAVAACAFQCVRV